MRHGWAATVMFFVVLAAPAGAQIQLPAKPQTASLDSEAPPGAPPHWLPNERWVMQHWLPYEERRLYRLLGVTRGDIWRWLRDDTRNLAGLARAKGWDPEELATALVEPWRRSLRDPERYELLRTRALRTLTQGHLSQHMFFHSLHQNAIPDNAPAIFGTASREEFQALRRSELSPLQICRLNGLSRSHAQRSAETTLRDMATRGVNGEAIPAAQAERLLARQLRQVPRWLQQTRYNGPPPLKQPRASIATASNYSNNAALSGDGRHVAYERYEAALPTAKTRGEIAVLERTLGTAAPPVVASRPNASSSWRTPRSSYNPAVSADGRFVAFETSDGNLNFAKRYGQMAIFVRDLQRGLTWRASPKLGAPRSAYNPTISGDGRLVAYESSESRNGALDVFVTDQRTGRTQRIAPPRGLAGQVYEPALSADGRWLAFTALMADVSAVYLRDLRTGATHLVSRASGRAGAPADADSYEPSVSADGARVAFSSAAGNLAPGPDAGRLVSAPGSAPAGTAISRVFVRDVRTHETTLAAPSPRGDALAADATAFEPALSGDGSVVAFSARNGGDRAAGVFARDLDAGVTRLVSRASGAAGAPAAGSSGHPSISADGRRVAFTSDAWNLSRSKCHPARGVFVRDLAREETTLVSLGDGQNRWRGPTKGSITGDEMLVTLLCA
jgi:Tol biopolymer transport system component